MEHTITCTGADDTEAYGERLGRHLRGGEVFELIGDVGSGKTTFVRGLAKGLGSTDHVSSPTFVVSKVYNGRLMLHHLDLYRLNKPGLVSHQLSEIVQDPETVIAIEWGVDVAGILPDVRIKIHFELTDDESRRLKILIPGELDYIKCWF